jgi:hypothetical protein
MPNDDLANLADTLQHLGGAGAGALDEPALLAATHALIAQRDLAPGLTLAVSLALDRASLLLSVQLHGLTLWSTTLRDGKLGERWTANQGVLKEDLAFTVDLEAGELEVSGDVCVLAPGGYRCAHFDDVLVRWSPAIGLVGDDAVSHAPVVAEGPFGPSRSIVPTVTRIPVDRVARAGTDVGNIVKETYFAEHPDFVFNVCFAVGAFPIGGPGPYTNPESPWFNVFVGYYQIDCPKPAWTRPFGYDLGPGGRAVRFDDVLRIGKADWNYFSNFMYGVPRGAIAPFDVPDPGAVCSVVGERVVGASRWDLVDVDGFSAVTAYTTCPSDLVDNTPLTRLWRVTYGEPSNVPGGGASFPGTRMRARLYMAFSEDADAFHTRLFGGTVNKTFDGPTNDALLAEQMQAVEAVIVQHYPKLGF